MKSIREDRLPQFLKYLQYEKNRSSHTVLSYKKDVEEFADFLDEREFEADVKAARMWVVSLLKKQEDSPRTVNRKISALRTFFNYLLKRGWVEKNPFDKVQSLKTKSSLPKFFRTEEVDAALESLAGSGEFEDVRDRLVINTLYQTGIRRSELTGLRSAWVDRKNRHVKVLGKRNKERIVPFGEELERDMAYYETMKAREVGETEMYFCRTDGTALTPGDVYRIVNRTMRDHSTQEQCSPHVLRHTFATSLLNEGAGINAVKELLGHSSLAATQVYTHLTFEQLQKIYKHAHPRAQKDSSHGN